MGKAKDIILRPIDSKTANALVKRVHYSGKVVQNSQLHIGVYYNGQLEGAMQFGPSLDKRKVQGLVTGTAWHEFIELNRMAFTEALPRNSESRALAVAMRLLRKHAPQLKWVVTFADATQCGDGTIYRAAGFVLTGISEGAMWELDDPELIRLNGGTVAHRVKIQDKSNPLSYEILNRTRGRNHTMKRYAELFGGRVLPGHQLRYIYFLDPTCHARLTVPELPYSRIDEIGAGMYRGEKRAAEVTPGDTPGDQPGEGGSSPTRPLT